MLALLLAMQIGMTDSVPRITLDEAIRRSLPNDPAFVAARGSVGNATWLRRSAWSSLLLPSITAHSDASKFSTPTFNLGTARPQDVAVSARLDAQYQLFSGGSRIAELKRSGAELDRAEAELRKARYEAALRTERDFYEVIAERELSTLAGARVERAMAQLSVARARVVSGAAVATDSLQVLLELNEARVAQLERTSALRVAGLQLGRRVGISGPVQPLIEDSLPPPALPISLEEAVTEARSNGPAFVAARASAEAADALVRAQRGRYFPNLSLSASTSAFDDRYFPSATTRSAITFSIDIPIWNNGQRELAVQQASALSDIAEATRLDEERAAERDVTEAYEAYTTAQATVRLRNDAVLVARESYRVQDTRYRAGAATILDLLTAQVQLSESETNLVQAQFETWIALAQLETILGRRIFNDGISR